VRQAVHRGTCDIRVLPDYFQSFPEGLRGFRVVTRFSEDVPPMGLDLRVAICVAFIGSQPAGGSQANERLIEDPDVLK